MAGMTMKVLCIMVACMVVASPYVEALTCSDVISKLSPCLSYLKEGGTVSAACCNGVEGLNAAANTTPLEKTACGCLKNAYNSISGIQSDNAESLPKKCGVNIPYSFSPNTSCNTIG